MENQEALKAMLQIVGEALQHERYITGLSFRLTAGDWEPWLPDKAHPQYNEF